MADAVERAHLLAEGVHSRIVHVPHRHAVRGVTDRVVVRDGTDAPDQPEVAHALEAHHHLVRTHAERPRDRVVRTTRDRQPCLRGEDDGAVDRVETRGWLSGRSSHHTVRCRSRKYSRDFGNANTGRPAWLSISAFARSMRAGVSAASTNHRLKAWSRS